MEKIGIALKNILDGFNKKGNAINNRKKTIEYFNEIKEIDDGYTELKRPNNDDALLVYRYLQNIVKSVVDLFTKLDKRSLTRFQKHFDFINIFEKETTTDKLINDYKYFFEQFVFYKNSAALGVGAFIISLIVVRVTPYHDEIIKTYSSLFSDTPFLKSLLQRKTDPLLSLNYSSIIHNINNLTNKTTTGNTDNSKNTKYVKEFHQKPFLLGLYSFLIQQNTGGTCQDNTLIQLISDDKQNKLSGFSIAGNYQDISHWFNNACSNTRFDYKDHLRVANQIRLNSSLGKRPDSEGFSERLFSANTTTPIDKRDYNSKATIFLLITLSHVYRHTLFSDQKVELVNYKNDKAFDETFVSSLIDNLKQVQYTKNTTSKNTNSITNYTFNLNKESIISILNRNIESIKNSVNKQEVKDDSSLNIIMGGSRNPFDSLIKKHIDTIKNKRDLKRFVKDAIKEDPKLQNKIIDYYLTHNI